MAKSFDKTLDEFAASLSKPFRNGPTDSLLAGDLLSVTVEGKTIVYQVASVDSSCGVTANVFAGGG